ncbi:MAG: hypothetical protein K0S47_4601 [Herbinix sp.]|nr:hypothetical protein [Herbinix sp.]
MKKTGKISSIIIAVAIVVYGIYYSFFNVKGTEISELLKNKNGNSIQIEKTYETSEKSDVMNRITLNEEQEDKLFSLINNSKFSKIHSSAVPYTDKDRYLITLTTADHLILLRMESYGGKFIIVDSLPGDSPPKHWKLKIRNNNWKKTLEEILG